MSIPFGRAINPITGQYDNGRTDRNERSEG